MLEQAREHLEPAQPAMTLRRFGMLRLAAVPRPRRAAGEVGFPYRYYNGGDAGPGSTASTLAERLRRDLAAGAITVAAIGGRSSLRRNWAEPVEHFSALFGAARELQAWSSLPAAVALGWADRVLAGDPAEA